MKKELEALYEKNPNLKLLWANKLIVEKEEFDKLLDGKSISIKELNRDIKIPINLLKKILTDDDYYAYMKKISESGYMPFSINYLINNDLKGFIITHPKSIIKALYSLKKEGLIKCNDKIDKRMQKLKENISYENFCKKCYNDSFDVVIEDTKYTVPVKYFIDFLNEDDKEYEDFFKNKDNYKEIKKEIFIYSLIKYYNARNVMYNYIIPKKIKNRCKEILSYDKYDVESINNFYDDIEINKKDIEKITDFELNEDLKNSILEGIPKQYSDIEKAIYIYIKLCKKFTYDEEYFIYNQDSVREKEHLDINKLSSKNTENNNIVCFEFNSIFAKLLNMIGINDLILDGNVFGMYGGGHQNLNVRIGKYMISADSVTSILNGDLVNAKLNTKLNGIKTYNQSSKTNEEFNLLVNKVYDEIKNEELKDENKKYDLKVNIQDKIKEYEDTINNEMISFDEKLEILINNLLSSNLQAVDLASYINRLRKILFTKGELDNNIGFTIIRDNSSEKAKLSMVFVINKNNINSDLENNIYYMYGRQTGLNQISIEELNSLFNTNKLNYIAKSDPKIKGVTRY